MMHYAFKFEPPFKKAHCVVYAYAHVAGYTETEDVANLAKILRAHGILYGRGAVANCMRFSNRLPSFIGKRIVDSVVCKGSSLQNFAGTHEGSWIVYCSHHAVAVLDGVIWGWYKPLARVQGAIRLE